MPTTAAPNANSRAGQRELALDIGQGLPLGEAVYRSLCEALRSGALRPGDRLREDDVAAQLKVSRTPVREALGRLMSRHLVEAAGGRGLIVRRLDPGEVLELYAMREILEGAAARLAAMQASAAEIDLLRDLQERFAASAGDASEMARLNRMFHEAMFRAARNRYLDSALRDMQDGIALLGPTTFGVAGRPGTANTEHQAMIEAIAARNPDAAEASARSHIREALRARARLMQG